MTLGPAFIVGIIVFIILAFIIIVLVKKVLKAIFLILALFLVVSLVLSFFIYRDVVDMQKNFEQGNSLILIELDGSIVAGVMGSFSGEQASMLWNVSDYNAKYQADDIDGLLGQNYKLMIFSEASFDNVDTIKIMDKDYSNDFIMSLLRSENPIDDYVDNEIESDDKTARYELRRQIQYSNTEFKSILFGALLGNGMEDRGFIFILEQYREGDVFIYKETLTFKIIKSLPLAFVRGLVTKAKTNVEGLLVNVIGD